MERFKNRWGYALTAFACSLTVLPIMSLIVTNFEISLELFRLKYLIQHSQITGFPTALAALICWPTRTARTAKRMTVAGILTVILALILMPLFMLFGHDSLSSENLIEAVFTWLILGTIFSFGIPYIMAVFCSLAFVDYSANDVPFKTMSFGKLLKRFTVEETSR